MIRTIEISDKDNKKYAVKIDEGSFDNKGSKDGREKWEVKFEVFDQEGFAGQGCFKINYNIGPEYSSADILNELINIGVKDLKRAIDNNQDISSIGFNFIRN